MAARPQLKIRYNYVDTYPLTAQRNWVGAQSSAGKRGWWNDLADTEAACNAMVLDPSNDRYLYYAVGTKIKRRDILLGTTTTLVSAITGGAAAIYSLFADASYLYVGGSYTGITIQGASSASRTALARINKSSLALDSWNPNCNDAVRWITGDPAGAGTLIYCGGDFDTVNGGTTRNRAAAFNNSGTATTWNPNLNAASYAGAWVEDGTDGLGHSVIIGGRFSTVDGVARDSIAEYTAAEALSSWNPNVTGGQPEVLAIAVDADNSIIYFGGEFTTIGATTRNNAAAMNYGGSLAAWNPNLSTTAGDQVNAIALIADHVYIGGTFATVGGTARVNLAKISKAAAGTLQPFTVPGLNAGVSALALFDRTVYVGGSYTSLSSCYPVLQGGSYGAYLNAFPDPLFTDANAFFVAKTGADTNAGTYAAPFLTVEKGRDALTGAFVYVVIADSGTYGEVLTWTDANTGLYALDGQAPMIEPVIGATPGTYGARPSGRTKFSTSPSTDICHVSKAGSDSTGQRGNILLPFLTAGAAVTAASSGDTIQYLDSGTYAEDVDTGAKALTFQAIAGEVPTLVNVLTGGSDEHFKANAGVALALYGLNIRELKSGTNDIVNGNFPLTIYDCTLSGTASIDGIRITGTDRAITVVNTVFENLTAIPTWQGDLVLTNCLFSGCTTPITVASTADSHVITYCSFVDTKVNAIVIGAAITTGTFTIKYCEFDTVIRTSNSTQNGWAISNAIQSTATYTISDCIFRNCATGAILIIASNWTVKRSLFEDNCLNPGTLITVESIQTMYNWSRADVLVFSGYSANTTGNVITNCVSINSGYNGFGVDSFHAMSAVLTLSNCTVVNAVNAGIHFPISVIYADAALSVAYTAGVGSGNSYDGVAEAGSVVGIASTQSRATNYSIVSSVSGGASAGATSIIGDAEFFGTDANIDTSFKVTSQALRLGDSTTRLNAGAQIPVLEISVAGVAVDGIQFSGLKNLYQGVAETADTYTSTVRYCSFSNLTRAGVLKVADGEVSNCLFENNGFGVQINNSDNEVKYNVFDGCSAAGILNAAFTEVIRNNTAYSCPYGQSDFQRSGAQVQKNNVYSSSGAFDYSGVNEQDYSDVERLGLDASVDANSTRLRPLFRDANAGDFRLQTVDAGYPYDSPAKNLGDDGYDAGAFSFAYGAAVPTYTEIDFNDTDYVNPISIPRSDIPVNLAEGDRDDGTLRSRANAYKHQYTMNFETTAMPSAQFDELQDMFEADDEEIKVTFDDGDSWIDFAIVKSEGFEWNDITGFWAQDDEPAPVASIVLRAL